MTELEGAAPDCSTCLPVVGLGGGGALQGRDFNTWGAARGQVAWEGAAGLPPLAPALAD